VAHVNQVGTCPDVFGYMSLPDSTPQRHAAALPGIKSSHLVFSDTVSSSDYLVSNDGTIKVTEKRMLKDAVTAR
jgi:hypothetical protein